MRAVILDSELIVRARLADYRGLIKARLTFLVLLTTLVGFYTGLRGAVDFALLVHTLLATGLAACGAAALNQWLESDLDAKMRRTQNRPLPAGRMRPEEAFLFGCAVSLTGIIYLAVCVNLLAGLLAAVAVGSYLFVYTPLKRLTWFSTIIGAVPGALPPLIGWCGARGELSAEAWMLFAIIFFWQMPHFFSIGWIYREDYAAAGFRMLSVAEPDGKSTARQSVIHAACLLPVSLIPWLLGLAGPLYLFWAAVLGFILLCFAVRFALSMAKSQACRLFYISIFYLPLLLLGLTVFGRP